MSTTFLRLQHFPGQATIAYRVTPVFKWGWLSAFFKPKARVDWAAALCSPADSYDEEKGTALAEERLDRYLDGRTSIAERRFGGSFYFAWTDYVEMERHDDVEQCVAGVIVGGDLLAKPKRWAKLVQ